MAESRPCAVAGCPALGEPVLCPVHRKYVKAISVPVMPRCGRCMRKIEPDEWYEPTGYAGTAPLHLKPCRPPKGQNHDQSRARFDYRRDRSSGAA